jgi:hypothetical protein
MVGQLVSNELEGFGKKWPWPNLGTILLFFCGSEENREIPHIV